MKATGIVRRIDDLGRVVIPKEIRRTMRIREGDPLEIYTDRDGEVIFKKYSPMGEMANFATQLCESLSKTAALPSVITDRDTIIAVGGAGKRELMDKRISQELEHIMELRQLYKANGDAVYVSDGYEKQTVLIAAPIICEGDVTGCVVFLSGDDETVAGDTELKLAQTVSAFLGRQMEN